MHVYLDQYQVEAYSPYKDSDTRLDFTVEMPFDELFKRLQFHEGEKLCYDDMRPRVEMLVHKAFNDYSLADSRFDVKKVIFSGPCTIILWNDGTKTKVTCGEGDEFDPEKGIAMCFMKKALGNKGRFNYTLQRCKEPYFEGLSCLTIKNIKRAASAAAKVRALKPSVDRVLEAVNNIMNATDNFKKDES